MKCHRCKYVKHQEYAAPCCNHDGNVKISYAEGRRIVVLPYLEAVSTNCPYFHEPFLSKLVTWFKEYRVRKIQKRFPENLL